MNIKSLTNNNWYCNSEHEPVAMMKNLFNSGIESRPQPSAILVGIEEEDLLICDINPYISSLGKFDVALYIAKVKSWLFCQNSNC